VVSQQCTTTGSTADYVDESIVATEIQWLSNADLIDDDEVIERCKRGPDGKESGKGSDRVAQDAQSIASSEGPT